MVKIFVGSLPPAVTEDELWQLFEEYGTVTECSIIKNVAFVHMEGRKAATKAIRSLHMHMLHGMPINVESSRGKNQGPVKLYVTNVEKGCDAQLRALFEEYGTVTECAVFSFFAFVHMPNHDEAMDAMLELDNALVQDKPIHVELSKSRPKYEESEEYPPPPPDRGSYWPPQYPGERPPPPSYTRGRVMPPGYPAPPPSPLPPPFPRRAVYPQHYASYWYSMGDYYKYMYRYRASPYGVSPYEGQRTGAPPPPPSAVVQGRPLSSSLHPYERWPPPPPPTPNSSAYYARYHSPIGRAPAAPMPPPSNGYAYDRSAYGVPRATDPYANRLPPPPPPPPPPYAY